MRTGIDNNITKNVRINPDLHRKAVLTAKQRGTTLNGFIRKAIENELNEEK